MLIDSIESQGLQVEHFDIENRLRGLNKELGTTTKPIDGCYQRIDSSIDTRFSKILGIDDVSVIASLHPTIMDATKEMLHGIERGGFKTMGLEDLAKWKLDPSSEYYATNLKQQSGFAAEIISTYRENLAARANGSELTTYRTDDLPTLFQEKKFTLRNGEEWTPKRNDQYIDKVRMNSKGEVVERIQTKFVGKNGEEWLAKMTSSKFEKYLDGEHVDKLECPKEFYDDIKSAIPEKVSKLEQQLERVKAEGKPSEVVEGIQRKIDKLNKIDEMVEQSNTTTSEAKFARLYPRFAAAKAFVPEVAKLSNKEGLKGGTFAAGLTLTVSAVDNISAYMDGEITAEEMVKDITKETAAAGALGYGTAFISTAVSQTMSASSSQLIRSVGGSCLPAAAVSFAVESYDSISSYAQGEIDGGELAYDLGENVAAIAGGVKGAAVGASVGTKVGAIVGTVAGPGGTVVGATVGGVTGSIVGGIVGCAVASEVYATAVEVGANNIEQLAEKAQEFADSTIDSVAKAAPEKLSNVKSAVNDFARSMNIPIHV